MFLVKNKDGECNLCGGTGVCFLCRAKKGPCLLCHGSGECYCKDESTQLITATEFISRHMGGKKQKRKKQKYRY